MEILRLALARFAIHKTYITAKILAIGEEFRKTIAAHIKYTYRFLKDSWFWLWEPLLFYIAVLLVALPIIASFLWPDKNVIRYAGLFLQLLGVGTVAWDILETRKFFDLLSIWKEAHQRFRRWLCDRPKYRRGIVVELETGTGVGVGSSDIKFVETKTSPDAAVEEKLQALEKNLEQIRDDLVRFQEGVDDQIAKLRQSFKQEEQTRVEKDQEIKDLLTDSETGRLHISMTGVMFLVLGITMSTISAELAEYMFKPLHKFLLN